MPEARSGPTGPSGNLRLVTGAVFWNFFGKSSLLAIRFAESVLLVRLLGGESYGLFGSLVNIEAIAILLISLGLEGAVNRFLPQFRSGGDHGRIRKFMRNVFAVRGAVLIPAAALFLGAAGFVSETLFSGLLPPRLLRAVFLLVIATSFHSLFRAFLDSFFKVRYLSLVDFGVQSCYLIAASLLVLYGGFGVEAVLASLIVCRAVAVALLWWKYSATAGELPAARNDDARVSREKILRYSWWLYFYTLLLYVLGKGMDVLLLGMLRGDLAEIAHYIIAFNISYYSLSVMDIAVSASFIVSLIVEAHHGGNTPLLRKIFTGLFEFIYVFTIPVAVGGLLLRDDLIGWIYGAENAGAADLMALFLVTMAAGKLNSITAYFLILMDRERRLALSRALFGLLNLGLALYAIPRWGALGAVGATGVVMVLISVREAVEVQAMFRPAYSGGFLLKSLASAGLMGLVVWGLNAALPAPPAVRLPATVGTGALVYLLCIRRLQPFSTPVVELVRSTDYPFKPFVLRALALEQPADDLNERGRPGG